MTEGGTDAAAYATIPDELKRRAQWLLTDEEPPAYADDGQPHWRGDYSVSWSNPDDWHTFEEAVEAAQERESWGIGYVVAMGNEAYPEGAYGVIDIDGGLTESGELKPWVPDLEPFTDAGTYIELSKSGTGLHIPLLGHEPPEWWTDKTVDHEGVEVFTHKFVVFTGEEIGASGSAVAEVDPTPWLREAFEALHGEPPNGKETQSVKKGTAGAGTPTGPPSRPQAHRDEWLTHGTLRDAVFSIPADLDHSTWVDNLYGIHAFDSGRRGWEIAVDWSRRGRKYNEEAQASIDWIWENATPNGGISVATVLHHAQEHGWSGAPIAYDGGANVVDVSHIPGAGLVVGANFEPERRPNGQPVVAENITRRVLAALHDTAPAKRSELEKVPIVNRERSTVGRAIRYLRDKELVKKIGRGPATRYDFHDG